MSGDNWNTLFIEYGYLIARINSVFTSVIQFNGVRFQYDMAPSFVTINGINSHLEVYIID